jgi:hypothetical protein
MLISFSNPMDCNSRQIVLIVHEIEMASDQNKQQNLRKGTAGATPDNHAVLTVVAGYLVLPSDCRPQRAMHQ